MKAKMDAAIAVGTLVLVMPIGKRYRCVAMDLGTMEATLEPDEPIKLEAPKMDVAAFEFVPDLKVERPSSRFLPGDPQPWKRKGWRR